jgi:hypothetical protein
LTGCSVVAGGLILFILSWQSYRMRDRATCWYGGGGPGQNLFLIDNVPLYYVNHLGGFISVFNPEVLNDVRVIKGGFPAKYGGKISSVVDITMREGDRTGFKGSAGIGLVGANITLEGPVSEKASYLFSARKIFTE